MKKVIWKHRLNIESSFDIQMPIGTEILALQTQNDNPFIWVLVNPDEKNTEIRKFETVGTGEIIEETNDKKYIGTYQSQGGLLVFHVFEKCF